MSRDVPAACSEAGAILARGAGHGDANGDAGRPVLPSAWPQLGNPGLEGSYRVRCEDFRVEELPGWTPDGNGEHLLLEVEKTGSNTAFVAQALAREAGIDVRDVSWCGAKDRHAVTRQWFSLRDPSAACTLAPGAAGKGWSVLAAARHRRKLRRGDHAGNRFRIRIELDEAPPPELLPWVHERLATGVPNYFGPQRFGRSGSNLHAAQLWVEGGVQGGRLPRRGAARGFLLSAARALLFNEVLAARLLAGSACSVLEGEALLDGEPTGPLWGRGRTLATGVAGAVEAAALAPWQAWCARLEQVGLNQQRRALWLRPRSADATLAGRSLTLSFTLPAGAFATAVLAGIGRFRDQAGRDQAGQQSDARDAPMAPESHSASMCHDDGADG